MREELEGLGPRTALRRQDPLSVIEGMSKDVESIAEVLKADS